MPRYDVRCTDGHTHEITAKWDERTVPCVTCAAPTERVWISSFPNIIGDEIDYVDHNIAKEPIRFRSKAERRRVMKSLGIQEKIRHVGVPGSDKSPMTKAWY